MKKTFAWIIFCVMVFTVAFAAGGYVFADSNAADFENFTLGEVQGQDGWTSGHGSSFCPVYDVAVVSNTSGISSFGTKSLRISNAITCGSFNDQTFSKSLVNEAGETSAPTSTFSGGTRQPYFEAQWDFMSAAPGSEQPNLSVVASPDRGDTKRMSWVQMQDTPTGLQVNFEDYHHSISDFITTPIATGLSRSASHTIKLTVQFVDGAENDIVKVYVDGSLAYTGTSWEDYYRDFEGGVPAAVDSILFRVGGTAAPANMGKGFLIDNFSSYSGPVPVVPGTLHVVESVINGNGGTAIASDFTVHVKSGGTEVSGSPAAGTTTPGTLYTLPAGTYALSQNAVTNYVQSFGGDCDASGTVTLAAGADKSCAITTVALTPTQTTADSGGAAVISSTTPQVVVASSTQAISVTASGTGAVSGAGIDVSPLVSGGVGVLPKITIAAASNNTIAIPDNTAIISADAGWDGVMQPATPTTATLPITAGVVKTLVSAVEIGATSTSLSFDRGVRLVFAGQAGKHIGHLSATAPLEEIVDTCSADSQAVGDALPANGDCKMDAGGDLVVWVRHFTTFVIYTQTGAAAISRGTGAGSYLPARIVPLIGITKVPTPSVLPSAGSVTYAYTVWNVGGQQALTKVAVKDDKCGPVTLMTGDGNQNGTLDPGERWQYQCTATISTTTTNTAVATGYSDDGYDQVAVATAVSTVAVGGNAAPAPSISITEVPSIVTPLPIGGGEIIYAYAVTNPGTAALQNVSVIDDRCRAMSKPVGDENHNNLLDPGEMWTYSCSMQVSTSMRNIVTASGSANGMSSSGRASARVLVTISAASVAPAAGAQSAPVSVGLSVVKAYLPGTFTRSLGYGMTGADVVALQAFLVRKGLLTIPSNMIAGRFGDLTRTAVMAYQRSKGISPVGIFGSITRTALLSELGE